jgi:hypothetical protein
MNESRILKPGPSTLSIPVGDGQIGRRVDPEQLMQIVGDICTTSPDALEVLKARSWNGNVRELKHRVESAALLTEGAAIDESALGLDPSSKSYYPPFDATTLG